jgi:CrcB protein
MSPLGLGPILLVAAGGALGSVLRYAVSVLMVASLGASFPWGTLAVNVLGSTAIGAMAALGVEGGWRLLLVTGLLGGFTTFSAFSLETALLWERAWWLALVYVLASVVLGLAGFALGYGLLRRG